VAVYGAGAVAVYGAGAVAVYVTDTLLVAVAVTIHARTTTQPIVATSYLPVGTEEICTPD
jgi:hypothetical protein